MTNPEFEQWLRELFIAFPSMRKFVSESIDPQATLKLWRRTLTAFTLEECQSVVDRWATGGLPPLEAYEREKTHLHVRSIICADRDRVRKREEQYQQNRPYYDRSGHGAAPMQHTLHAAGVLEPYLELRSEQERLNAGQISAEQFDRRRQEVLDGIK